MHLLKREDVKGNDRCKMHCTSFPVHWKCLISAVLPALLHLFPCHSPPSKPGLTHTSYWNASELDPESSPIVLKVQSVVTASAASASASAENMLEMQILGPHHRPTEFGTRRRGPSIWVQANPGSPDAGSGVITAVSILPSAPPLMPVGLPTWLSFTTNAGSTGIISEKKQKPTCQSLEIYYRDLFFFLWAIGGFNKY